MTQTIEELREECLARFEGHDYEPNKTCFAWHVHHDRLMEPLVEPVVRRVNFMLRNKPSHEIATRLQWLWPVKGKLPSVLTEARDDYDKVEVALNKEGAVRDEASNAYNKASVALKTAQAACNDDYAKAHTVRDEARATYNEASTAYSKARGDYREAWAVCVRAYAVLDRAMLICREKLQALHAKELPGCPWDGKELVF